MLTPVELLIYLTIAHLSVFFCLMIPVIGQFGEMCDRLGVFGALRTVVLTGALSLVPYSNVKQYVTKEEPIQIRFVARKD